MKAKRWLTTFCALAMSLLLTVPAMAEDGIHTSGTTALSEVLKDIDLGSTDNIQFLFAKLQLAQAQLCKDSANSYIQQIEGLQAELTLTVDTLEKMRQLQADGATEMPDDVLIYMRDRGLAYYEPDSYVYWSYNIESVTTYQDSLTSQTQTMMVYLQDFISQYNSYLLGANNAVNSASETLTALAAAQRGGSLFSTDGAATASGQYALVAFSALIGGAGGTALMWAILNRKKTTKEETAA